MVLRGARRAEGRATAASFELAIPVGLFGVAALGWWWSARMAGDMADMGSMDAMSGGVATMSLGSYVVGWVAMMTAMMFPAISPMVRLYARAAGRGTVAPVPFFVAGYLVVWSAVALPAYFAWRQLADPLADGVGWVGRLAGGVLILAAAYQLTPLKSACLQHCRSPVSFFLHHASSATSTPTAAVRLGAHHGIFCLGCCWAIMAILVSVGTMHLGWMVLLTVVIVLEKLSPRGELVARVAAVGFAAAGIALLADPSTITTLT